LRILIFTWRDLAHPKAGGAEIYTNNVAREWVRAGHDVSLFCASVEGRPANQKIGGVHIIRRGTQYSVYREAMRFYLEEGRGKFDLIIDEVNTRPFLTPKWVDDAPVIALTFQVCRNSGPTRCHFRCRQLVDIGLSQSGCARIAIYPP